MHQMDTVQQAVSDLAMIRKAIEGARGAQTPEKARRSAWRAKVMAQASSLVMVLLLCVLELVSGNQMTSFMLLLAPFRRFGLLSVVQVGAVLAICVMVLYFIVWRSARHSDQEFSLFVAANFRYLRGMSLLTDLFIKFIIFSLVLLAPRPEWIPPLLMLFTADYLFQGRFFTLPIRASLLLGLVCLTAAGVMYFTHTTLLLWPLSLFAAVNLGSLVLVVRTRQDVAPAEKEQTA